ncbi:MAG: Uma2 family endonuclease [Chloroflexota bacterium]
MRAEIAHLDRPAEDLFDSEEQDEPLAGQDHRDTIDSLSYPLRGRLASPNCYVAAELRVHRNSLDLRDYKEPDILVALGVADAVRPSYFLWVEGKAPDLVIEVLSPSSLENKDLTEKKDWYRQEGVREYLVLDPSGDFAPEPRLQAWLLEQQADGGDLHRVIPPTETLWCTLIPFGFWLVDGQLRAVDRTSGEVFLPIWDVEPQLRREVALRQAAHEEARLAHEEARLVQERAAQWQESAQRETALRRALEDELARLRRQSE